MILSLSNVVPVPLRDRITARRSGLWNSNVTFAPGQYIFVQAPSGTGKTTLVHVLYGLRTDYTGTVSWTGQPLTSLSSNALATLRTNSISVIFQDMRLFPELTAWENIEIKRQLTDSTSKETVGQWFDRLGLKDKKQSLGSTLSYGEQQRVAIIRALVQPFTWLLMDEPFSHLDNANTDKARALILEVVKQNNAGFLLADLDENTYFPYTQTILL